MSVANGVAEKRLKFACRINPSRTEVLHLPDSLGVSFVPMERVTEDGEIRTTEERPLGDVRLGFTYFKEEDVLVAKITPCFENGKGGVACGLRNGVGFGSTEFHVLRALRGVEPRYVFYVTRSNHFREFGAAMMYGAAGQQRVPEDFVKDYLVHLPPLPEQQAISDFLDRKTAEIDGLIARKQRLIDLLGEKRQALISHAVTKGLNPDAPMKDSGIEWLGEVPEHWKVERLKFCVRGIAQGWSPQCENRQAESGEWGVLKVGCMNSGVYDEAENKALPPELTPLPELEVRIGDVLMSRSNTVELVGSVGRVHATQGKILLCDKLYRLNIRASLLDPEFAVHLLRSHSARLQIQRDASGASPSMKNISIERVANLLFAFPPINEQKTILERLQREIDEGGRIVRKITTQIAKLREYRQTLISAAVTGKLDVSKEMAQ